MINKLSRISFIICIVVLCTVVTSCNNSKIDKTSFIKLKSYFDFIEEKEYQTAYNILHPLLRDKVTYEEYITNLKKGQKENGDILAVKFDGIVSHVKDDYVYRVTLIRERKIIKYNMEMLKEEDGEWYLNAVKGIAEKERKP